MPRRNDLENRIIDHLGTLAYQISLRSTSNRQDLSVSCEKTFCGLLNLLMGWKLVDMNEEQLNYPGVDLADTAERVAVQVTSNNTPSKVRETLKKFFGHNLDAKFKRLIVLVVKGNRTSVTEYTLENGFVFQPEKDIWDLTILKNKILALNDVEPLQQIADYLDQELGTLSRLLPENMLLPPIPQVSESFVPGSREEELKQLLPGLNGQAPVFIWGLGGMGKTQVAIKLAERWENPAKCYFLRYTLPPGGRGEAMRETILQADFADYCFEGADTPERETEYRQRMDMLRKDCRGALLIIDNFDWPGKSLEQLKAERSYGELTAMIRRGLHLVFTTRSPVEMGTACQVGPISDGSLVQLMRTHYRDKKVTDEQLLELIRAVNGHTLMAELMAKTLQKSWGRLRPADMLIALKNSDLKRREFQKIASTYNPQAQIYAHLQTLFDLSEMKAEEENVLRWATLLPDDGMLATLFEDCVPPDHQEAVHDLVDRGWLFRDEEKNLLTIHPVVREVCREELTPEDANCAVFLENLWNRFDLERDYDAGLFLQIAKCFSAAAEVLKDGQCSWCHHAGEFWKLLGRHQTAFRYRLKVVQYREKFQAADPLALAAACEEYGSTCGTLGKYDDAFTYKRKALTLLNRISPPPYALLAHTHNSMGFTYSDLGNHKKALEHREKAVDIFQTYLPEDRLGLARAYNNLGSTYGELEDHEQALHYKKKALAIREQELPPDHPDVAVSYSNVGGTYKRLGDLQESMRLHRKALAIREQCLLPNHPHIAISYSYIGMIHAQLRQYDLALPCFQKALAIQEKAFPEGHTAIKRTLRKIKWVTRELRKQEQAARKP